jgi:hypothetical protein
MCIKLDERTSRSVVAERPHPALILKARHHWFNSHRTKKVKIGDTPGANPQHSGFQHYGDI